jgi:hypothetical protein
MAEFVSDCPRCGAVRSTHDVFSSVIVGTKYNAQRVAELACICRTCKKLSIHLVSQISIGNDSRVFGDERSLNTLSAINGSINPIARFERHITLRDRYLMEPPEHLPKYIEAIIVEANSCLSNECWNAAGAMYRLALDMSTKSLLPSEGGPNTTVRRSLGHRLQWLFENDRLNLDLKDLAESVQQDGNDGSHDGSLTQADAEDLKDFCYELLKRVYTIPKQIELAKQRREERRKS